MSSNRIVIAGKFVELYMVGPCTASNYLEDEEPEFKVRGLFDRGRPTNFVLHETAGAGKHVRETLVKRGLGVHFILWPERPGKLPHLSCHADPAHHVLWHAGQMNDRSVGIEIVNPYRPEFNTDPNTPWKETIPAEWWTWVPKGKEPAYVLPTPGQLSVLEKFVPEICERLSISCVCATPQLDTKTRRIDGWNAKPAACTDAGVVAHQDFSSHSDGRYPLEYLRRKDVIG